MRSVISICVPLFATSRVGTYGTVALATNELMRQLYLGSLTLLAGWDISAQALVASYLGQVMTSLLLTVRCCGLHRCGRFVIMRNELAELLPRCIACPITFDFRA